MTTYQRFLHKTIESRFGSLSATALLDKLFEMGVVDFTRCKVLAVRTAVDTLMRGGMRKVDAMYQAAEDFACSYEYVRKCMYYYTDVNMD